MCKGKKHWNKKKLKLNNNFSNENAPSYKKNKKMQREKSESNKCKTKKLLGGYIQLFIFSEIKEHKNTASTAFSSKIHHYSDLFTFLYKLLFFLKKSSWYCIFMFPYFPKEKEFHLWFFCFFFVSCSTFFCGMGPFH